MRLKILLNLGSHLPDWKEGQVVDCEDEELGNRLIREGLAESEPETAKQSKPSKQPKEPAGDRSARMEAQPQKDADRAAKLPAEGKATVKEGKKA